jgi:hypothetical protein
MLEQRLEGKRVSHAENQERAVQMRKNKCKGPGAGLDL